MKNKDLTNVYKIDEAKGLVKYTVKAHGMYFTGKSKANVDEGDVFDLEKGKRIAKLRALLKMKRHFLKESLEFQQYIRDVASMEDEVTEQVAALTNSLCHLEDQLNDVLGIPTGCDCCDDTCSCECGEPCECGEACEWCDSACDCKK